MQPKFFTICLAILISASPLITGNEPDTLRLDELIIPGKHSPDIYSGLSRIIQTVSKETISGMQSNNIQGILESITTLDVRQRGSHGVQADISMRGGSFEQVLILLNGMRINDPQTGHHNLNIPVNTSDIERIEILEGPGARIYGPNAFSGAINIITKEPGETNIFGALTGGEFGYVDLYASGGLKTGPLRHYVSAGNKSSDGFTDNTDFEISNLFYRSDFNTGQGILDLQAGYLEKGFGASNFYTSLYPEQYEKIVSSFANLTYSTGNRITYRHSAYWRRHRDLFKLFRYDAASWYAGHNYHMTDISGTNAAVTIPFSLGNIFFGAEGRFERIYSSVLGEKTDHPRAIKNENEAFYDHYKLRRQINLTVGNSLIFKRFAVSSGLLVTKTEPADWGIYGGADMSYRLGDAASWIFSINQSLRIPSFTEMYYSSPVHKGNPNLMPEKAVTVETGIRLSKNSLRGHIAVFRRQGKNIIDWVKMNDDLIWESKNITFINSGGLEIDFAWSRPPGQSFPVTEIRFGYGFLHNSRQSENFISAYVLDFLRHKIVSGVTLPLFQTADLMLMAVYQDRSGSYTDFATGSEVPYNPFLLADAGIRYCIAEEINVLLDINNLFNTTYTDIGNVPVPGRWIRAGINFTIPMDR
jgi:vitamin B12 transporter